MMVKSSSNSNNVRCPVCEGGQASAFGEKDGYGFLKCDGCGYIFCHPRPSQQQLAEFYAMGDAGAGITATSFPKVSSRKRRGFFNALKLLPHYFARRALDVGCGGGFVVGAMKMLGAREAHGIDINPNATNYAKEHYPNCYFHTGSFDEVKEIASGFDFIYSSEVIEHVEDVEQYVGFLKGALKPGGVVFLTTPDIESDQVPEDKISWNTFSPPQHIQFFSEKTLTMLMRRFGFSPIRRASDRGGAGIKMLFRLD